MKKIYLLLLIVMCSVIPAISQKKVVNYGQLTLLPRQDKAMQDFRSNRFGQFIHWGLFSVPGGEWNGKIYPGASEFLPSAAHISREEWRKLALIFNPVRYDAKAWAKAAKKMGARYATLTTKHHDGFCLWPSEYTDFDVDMTPSKRDLVGEFVRAYNEEGIDVYLYYSILDWDHPDWRYDLKNAADTVAFDRFKTYVRHQLNELLDRYPTTKGIWIDGTWDGSWKKNGIFSYELEKELKEKHPGLIVNSRLRADEYGARHFDSNGLLMGDYESGYERRLPSPYDKVVPTRDWESCMTIAENLWGYHKEWKGYIKTDLQIVEMLVRSVALNGNFLLNFGPTPEGDFRQEEMDLMKNIGRWMRKYHEAIYDCGYAGLERQDWGYYTAPRGGGKVNLVVFNVPANGLLRVKLDRKFCVSEASFMAMKGKIEILPSVNGEYFLRIPQRLYKEPFVIQMMVSDLKGGDNHYMPPLI